VSAALADLAQRGGEQPLLERRFTGKTEVGRILQNLAANRLDDVRLRLASAQRRADPQPDESSELWKIALDECVDRRAVAAGGGLGE